MAVENPTKTGAATRSRAPATKPAPPVDLDRRRGGVAGRLRGSLAPRPYVSTGRSGLEHWPLVGAVIVVCVALAGAAALARTPAYSAEARLVVGRSVDWQNYAAVPGLTAATQQLASDFSRLVSTGGVVDDATKLLGRSTLGGTMSASPIPQSPVIRLDATAASPADALAIANAGARALVSQVNSINASQTKTSDVILKQYRDADSQLLSDTAHLNDLKNQLQAAGATAGPALKDQAQAAQTAVDADNVKLQSLATAYGQTADPVHIIASNVTRVGAASPTGNDRMRTLELYVLAGLVIGALLGIGLSAFVDRRGVMRRRV